MICCVRCRNRASFSVRDQDGGFAQVCGRHLAAVIRQGQKVDPGRWLEVSWDDLDPAAGDSDERWGWDAPMPVGT